jgi:uncharacterized membrane protein YjjP (DUF1212 family)
MNGVAEALIRQNLEETDDNDSFNDIFNNQTRDWLVRNFAGLIACAVLALSNRRFHQVTFIAFCLLYTLAFFLIEKLRKTEAAEQGLSATFCFVAVLSTFLSPSAFLQSFETVLLCSYAPLASVWH